MDESDSRFKLFAFNLIAAIVAGVWYFMSRPSTTEAIDETVDVFVPDAEEFNRRMSHIDEARRVADLVNSRQAPASKDPD